MADWLGERGLTSERLRWFVEYACRDDYGSRLEQTSAWAAQSATVTVRGLALGQISVGDRTMVTLRREVMIGLTLGIVYAVLVGTPPAAGTDAAPAQQAPPPAPTPAGN